jgi:hypothetical protein
MIPTYLHHSPSSLNQFAASPALFVLERILGLKQVVGAPAHRGVGVEAGVSYGLINPKASDKECAKAALTAYDTVSALSPDERKERYRETVPDMVKMALDELRPYGVPTSVQGHIDMTFPGVRLPIVGYYDFIWEDTGVVVDLKTTERMPSEIKIPHARQVSLYCGDNHVGRLTYTTPKKCVTYQLENIREHREALIRLAQTVERFLSLSDDPAFYTTIVAPDLESYFWTAPRMRQLAFEYFGV